MYVELKYSDGTKEKVLPYKPGLGFRVTFGPGIYVVPVDDKKLVGFRVVNNMEHGRFYLVSSCVNRGGDNWKNQILAKASSWKDFPYYEDKKREKKSGLKAKVEIVKVREQRDITSSKKIFVVTKKGKFSVDGIDVARGGNQTIIYTNRYYRGPNTRTNNYGIEIVVLNDKVVKVCVKGNNPIPAGGYVVSVHTGQKNKRVWTSLKRLKTGDRIWLADSRNKKVAVYDVNTQAIIDTGVGRFVVDFSNGLRWKKIESPYLVGGFDVSPEIFSLEIQDGRLDVKSAKLVNTPDRYNERQEIGQWVKKSSRVYTSLDMKVDGVLSSKDKSGRSYVQVTGNVDCVRLKIILTADVRGLEVSGTIYNLSETEERLLDIKLPMLKGRIANNRDLWAFMPASIGGALTDKDVSLNISIGGYLRNRIYGVFERKSGKAVYFHHTSRSAPIHQRVAILQKAKGKIKLASQTSKIFCYTKR
jgi:hypothetical protein